MPRAASSVVANPFLRVVILGAPKSGKTTSVVTTCPKPCYVIESDGSEAHLQGAVRITKDFEFDLVTNSGELDKAINTAVAGVKRPEGGYQTVVLDTLSSLAQLIEAEELKKANDDGRRAYSQYARKLRHIVRTLFALPCHVVICSHFISMGDGIDGKPKQGIGIFPLLAGSARESVAALCPDMLMLELRKDGSRVFIANPQGAWGAGMKSIAAQNVELPADIQKLIEYITTPQEK